VLGGVRKKGVSHDIKLSDRAIEVLLGPAFFYIYFVLGVIFFVLTPIFIGTESWGKSLFLAVGLMTGSDPFTFEARIAQCWGIWMLAWIIHVASWLFMPILAGIVINNVIAYISQTRKARLRASLRELAIAAGITEEDVEAVVDKMVARVELVEELR
jgi:hypothetical protein